jgi:transposase
MRYELSDCEWTAIKPLLPNKPRGVRRVNDRRVLNGIFWVLRSGAPWHDLPENYGPPHYLLQSLRSVAAGWRLGPDHGCTRRRL